MSLFTIISVYENIFSDRKKMIKILSRTFLESCQFSILENCDRYMSATNGEGDLRAEGIILLKFESDTATLKNIAIIVRAEKHVISSSVIFRKGTPFFR